MVDLQILVPLHNKGAYVREALDSILRQQTTYTFEVLIADDASQDDGPTIADEYARHHSAQFKIFRHSVNIGCLANTVSLYEKISARYFTVLDPDDFWIDDRHIETALNFLEKNPEFTLFLSNTWLEKNGERSKMYSVQSQVVEFFPLDRIVLGHTSATFFRAQESFARVLPVLKSHVGMCTERAYEGDTFRVLFYLSEGKGYFSNDVRSVYRYTNQGIWAQNSAFKGHCMNAVLFLEMARFFKGHNEDAFLASASRFVEAAFQIMEDQKICVPDEETRILSSLFVSWIKQNNSVSLCKGLATPTFVFFLPSRVLGVYEFLFSRLARSLCDDLGFNVYFIDYADGVSCRLLMGSDVKMVDYEPAMTDFFLPEDCTIVIPFTLGFEIPRVTAHRARLLSWCAHPKSIWWLQDRTGAPMRKVRDHLKRLVAYSSLVFMDWPCWRGAVDASGVPCPQSYVPVFCTEKIRTDKATDRNIDCIHIGWLGRLDADKTASLSALIKNLLCIDLAVIFKLHVIGDGTERQRLEELSAGSPFEVVFTGTLVGQDLDNYLHQNIDLMFAMGISALEAASLKIPTVLVFLSDTNLDNDHYLWLFDSPHFGLGMYVSQVTSSGLSTRALNQILTDYRVEGAPRILGEKCYAHFAAHHALDVTLVHFLRKSRLAGLLSAIYAKPSVRSLVVYTLSQKMKKNPAYLKARRIAGRVKRRLVRSR